MPIELPNLPYRYEALEPLISGTAAGAPSHDRVTAASKRESNGKEALQAERSRELEFGSRARPRPDHEGHDDQAWPRRAVTSRPAPSSAWPAAATP